MVIPRVKICGITRVEDALAARDAGADAIGIVFYPPSVRFVADLGLASEIAQAVGPLVNVIGLFVDAGVETIDSVLAAVPLNALQFHGDETESECTRYQRPYIKALRMKNHLDLERRISEYPSAVGILLDTYVEGAPGGTGKVFNWKRFPSHCERHLVLAGGLTPDNITAAVSTTRPYAVDVSGGVESAPGIKSREKIFQFITRAKLEH